MTTTHTDPWGVDAPAGTSTVPIQIVVISFGYDRGPAPTADITMDVRRTLYDHIHEPHTCPVMRRRTGLSRKVRRHVLVEPGAREVARHAAAGALDLLVTVGRRVTIAIGCTDGRHRSVVIAKEIARLIRADGITAHVDHRDIDKPVLSPSEKEPS